MKIDKNNVENIMELTSIQQGMLFHYINDNSIEYQEQLSLNITGDLNIDLLQKSLDYVVETNEMLRTIFRWQGMDKPIQIVLKKHDVLIKYIDLTNCTDQQKSIYDIKSNDFINRIDITCETLRVYLCKLEDLKFEMIMSNHHILYDGWSNGIILKELTEAYKSLYINKDLKKIQKTKYADFIKYIKSKDEVNDTLFWSNYLDKFEFNDSFFKGSMENRIIDKFIYRFSTELINDLYKFSKQNKITIASILYCAWGVILQNLNNSEEIVFGTIVSGRNANLKNIDEMVGLFINTIPLRLKFNNEDNLLDLIKKIDISIKERSAHEYSSLIDIKKYCNLKTNENLFNTIVGIENYPIDFDVNSNAISIESVSINERTNYNMTLEIRTFNGIELNFNYNSKVLSIKTVQKLGECFENIVNTIINNAYTKVSDIIIITEEEKNVILHSFNDNFLEYPKNKTIQELFEMQAHKTPNKIAVVCEDKEITYKQLNEKSNQLARTLREEGIEANTVVGILVEPSVDMIICIMGILKSGGAYLPIELDFPKERIKYILKNSGTKILLIKSEDSSFINENIKTINIGDEKIFKGNYNNLKINNKSSDLAYVIYTSGTTGNPKGVLIEHKNVLNLAFSLYTEIYSEYEENLNIALIASYVFDASVQQIFPTLLFGNKLFIVPKNIKKDGLLLLKYYNEKSIDISDGTPVHISMLNNVEDGENIKLSIKHFIIGGDIFNFKTAYDFYNKYESDSINITNVYGPTECCVDCTLYHFNRHTLNRTDFIPIGKPIHNEHIYILGKGYKVLPVGVVGEIFISGDGVGRGYLNNEILTKEKFINNPLLSDKVMYKTGDLGRWNENGEIEFLGREDQQVKIRGFRIELSEIENKILNYKKNKVKNISQTQKVVHRCTKCLLTTEFPNIYFNEDGVCNYCISYENYKDKSNIYFEDLSSFVKIIKKSKIRKKGIYDCLLLYSGGKDSTYVLYRLVEMGLKVLAFTFDNGFISETAFANIKKITSRLKVDSIICKNKNMDKIFLESLKTDYTVCTGCFKALTSISTKIAYEKGINLIITGLSRGQIFDTKLQPLYEQGILNPKEIEKNLLQFRKVYHLVGDKTAELLDIDLKDQKYFDETFFVDFFRYEDISSIKILEYLKERDEFWDSPSDTGFCSTNCLINDVGIYVHLNNKKYHNYESPLSWDCRLGKLSREIGLTELETVIDEEKVNKILHKIGYVTEQIEEKCIKKVVVLDREDDFLNKYLCAYFVSDEILSASELRQYLSTELPGYMIPTYFVRVNDIPVTINGKIDKKALIREKDIIRDCMEYIKPNNDIEIKLQKIWSEVLKIEKISIKENFFDLGGHSLNAMILVSKIHKEFNVEILIKDLFKAPTIEELGKLIKEAEENPYSRIEKIEEREYYPASSAQKRLYTLQQFESGYIVYNMPGIFELEGRVDKEKLENVFEKLIERHEVLRTSFETIEGEIVQKVHNKVEFNIEYIDNLECKNDVFNTEENIKSQIKEFVKPFDLSEAPLLRICLVRIEKAKYILMFDMHHIISDGTTMGILTNELSELYTGKELEALRVQYKDYAAWQLGLLKSDAIKEQKQYWIERFSDEIPALNMPYDYERPAIQSFKGNSIDFKIEKETAKKLRILAKETGSTMYMVLLSTFNILLSKYSGQQDIIIGSPIAGRSHADLENIMGMFVNTLVMRNYPEGNKSYIDFLSEVRENSLKAYENQDYQFEELVDNLNLRRDMSRNALFDVMFVLQNMDVHQVSIKDFTLNQYVSVNKIAKFDLNLTAVEIEENINFNLEYCTSLFKEETIKKMIVHFKKLLEIIIDNRAIKLSEIEVITENEKNLLKEFNNTETDYPRNKTIQELFEEQVEKTPNNIAVTFEDEHLSYKELNKKANKLARVLRNMGVNKESIVGIMLDRSLDMIVGTIAVIKAGGACLPINTEYPQKRIDYMLEDSRAEVVLTESKYIEKVSEYTNVVECGKNIVNCEDDILVDEEDLINIVENSRSIVNLDDKNIYDGIEETNLEEINIPEDLLYVIYTSGTTGNPKGVMVGQKVLNNLIHHDYIKTNIDFSKKLLQYSNISFDAFFHEVLVSLLNGGELCVASEEKRKDIVELFNYINEKQITTVNFPAALAKFIFNNKEYADKFPKSIKHLITTGEQLIISDLLKEYIKKGKLCLHNHYGPSETHVATTYTIDCKKDIESIPPIGKPIINTKAYILNEKYKLQPVGVVGELYVSGDCLGIGYLNRKELTEGKFLENPFEPGTRMYRTGDFAKWLPDGNIEFLGRIDNQVKIRGFRVELAEIEVELMKHEDIKEVVVIDRKDNKGDSYLCAYLVSNKELNMMEIRSYLVKEMPEYMIPTYFMQINEMPLTTNGKVDKRALPEPDGSIDTGVEYEATRNNVEEILVEIWDEVLGVEKIGINDNFFDLGGHSLKATILVAKIHKKLNVQVPLKEIFKDATIKGISKYIKNAEKKIYYEIEKVDEKEYYPASSAQKRLYTLQQFESGYIVYNMPGIFELEGRVDKEKLENVFEKLIERHEVLRTSFETIEGEIVQKVHNKVEFNIEYIDNLECKNDVFNIEENIISQIKEFVKPFDLSKAPLLRIWLVRIEEAKYILMFDMHHIISDGTTMGILTNELSELYAGKKLESLRVQYKDYAAWQLGLLKSDAIKEQKQYWVERFSDEIPALNMPYDYERPAIQSFKGSSIDFKIEKETTEKLRMLAKETGSTTYMVLLSAFSILLSKYSGQQDIIIGSPIAGRPHADLENIMGMFVNTLVMRNYPEGNKSYIDFLSEVRENSLKAYENQDYQFEELVDNLNLRRDMSRNALFDVMFVLQNMDVHQITTEDFTLKQYVSENKIAKFDLNLTAVEGKKIINFNLEYCTSLFNEETIKKMIVHFKKLLEIITDNKAIELSEIDIITEDERNKLLKEFNNTETDYPKNKTIKELFEEQVEKTPDNIAVTFEDKHLTYKELNEKANKLARVLRNIGVNKESIVEIMLDRSLDMIVGTMAVIKAGGACLPINTEYPQKRIDYMLEDSGAEVVLTESKYIDKVTKYTNVVDCSKNIVNCEDDILVDEEDLITIVENSRVVVNINDKNIYDEIKETNLEEINTPKDLLYVIYTSGTTGNPKGVMVGQKVLNNLIHHDYIKTNIDFSKKLLQYSNISFDAFFHEVLVSLLNGGELCVASEEKRKDIVELFNYINEKQITTVNFPAALAKFIFNNKEYADKFPKSIKHLITTGEQLIISDLLKEYIKKGKLCLHNHYGPSETHVATTYTINCKKDIESIPSIGKPIINTKAYILNEKYKLQPIGVVGELYVSGDCLGIGYLNRKELTEERFIENPFKLGTRMYKTGDFAKWLPDGNIEFLGRIDNQVKIRGFRVELAEIEVEFMKHKDIKEVVVIDRKDNKDNNYLCAYLVSEKELKISEIRSYLAKEMPEYMVPSYFIQIKEIPLTSNGKVDKNALPEPEDSINSEVEYEAPRNKVEEILAEIWSEVLGVEKIGINDNFFELGGHSLKATILTAKIHKELNVQVPLKEIFKDATIKGISEYIKEAEENPYFRIEKVEEREYYPASSAQKRMYMLQQFDKESVAYNMPCILEIEGEVDKEKLEITFGKLIERHEVLRTSFSVHEGEIVQRVYNPYKVNIDEINIEGDILIDEVVEEFVKPFNLEQLPILRVVIVKFKNCKTYLLTDMHHILSDGISNDILISDFKLLFSGKRLAKLDLQYKDFAYWQNNFYESEIMKKQENYWLNIYKEKVKILRLPYDNITTVNFEGDNVNFNIDKELVEEMTRLGRNIGCTLNNFLFAIFNILLYQYTMQNDIVVGIPVVGRQHADEMNIVGVFINTLALRSIIDENKTFIEFLKYKNNNLIDAYENQSYPLEKLISKINIERSMGINSIFNIIFNMTEVQDEIITHYINNTGFKPYHRKKYESKFDLSFNATHIQKNNNIICSFSYKTGLFKRETVTKMGKDFLNIIKVVLMNRDIMLHQINILSQEEKREVLLKVERNIKHENKNSGNLTKIKFIENENSAVNDLEEKILKIWKDVLKIEVYGVNDNFFEFGGDSLKVIKIINQMRNVLGIDVYMPQIFENNTVRLISKCLSDEIWLINNIGPKYLTLLNEKREINLFGIAPVSSFGLSYKDIAPLINKCSFYALDYIEDDNRVDQYINIIKSVQPCGPYILLGWSAGGLIAYDIAKKMEYYGDCVLDIILLDSVPLSKDQKNMYAELLNTPDVLLLADLIDKTDIKNKELINQIDNLKNEKEKNKEFLERFKDEDEKRRFFERIYEYNKFVNEIDSSGKINANMHLLQVIRVKDDNLNTYSRKGWEKLTNKCVTKYNCYGTHFNMLDEYAFHNARILNRIIESILSK